MRNDLYARIWKHGFACGKRQLHQTPCANRSAKAYPEKESLELFMPDEKDPLVDLITSLSNEMSVRFDGIDQRFDDMAGKMDRILGSQDRLSALYAGDAVSVRAMESTVHRLEQQVAELRERVANLESR
jgi:hypothetical protein